jgi:enoyl-CoA hydratase
VGNWTLEARGKVALLTFTRPPRNLMDMKSMTELADALDDLATRTDEFTVVMLTGGVDGFFIAHADLDDLAKIANGEAPEGDPRSWGRAMHQLENMPQPTVAAIDGQAWGGGCETSLACTMRIGSDRAHMGQPEVAIGIIPGGGGTQRLPRLVGSAIGAELCLSGRVIDAAEAKRIGLLNEVLPTDGFVDAALEWCERIARHPAHAVFAAKQAVVEGLRLPLDGGLRLEVGLFLQTNASDDAKTRNAAVRQPDGSRGI